MKFDNIYILVPAFNEAKIIRIILIALLERFPNVVVINDGSTDNIMEATKDLDITLLNHEINLGVGAAVQTGFDYVQRIPLSYAAITFDADGQHSVEDAISIAKAIQLCEEEIIFGSRFIEHDKNIPFIKRNVLRFVTLFTKIATGIKLTDAHNGLKAYKVSAIRKLKLRFSGYSYESELITEVAKKKK